MAFCTKCGKELEGGASVCPNCGAPVPSAAPSAPAVQLKTNRGLIKYILLSIITLGIYGLVVMSSVSTDINTIASRYDGKKTMHFCLLGGIGYSFGAGTFWGWEILGALIAVGPFIYLHKLFKAMNLLSEDYNTKG